MEKLQIYTDTLQTYASFFDAVGDYKSSDECTEYLVKISKIQDKNIRLSWSFTKMFGLDKAWNWIKEQGKKVDKWVRDKKSP